MTEHGTTLPETDPATLPEGEDAPQADVTDAVATDAPEAPTPTFADFDVDPDIVAALADAGIVHPFPIQAMTLPVALGGHDIIGQAKTGTGKTLGFGVPMLNRIDLESDDTRPQALAVAPTRELASQVAADLERAGKRLGIKVLTVYGGRAYEPQIEALKQGVHVVVGTPGRLIDLAQQLVDARQQAGGVGDAGGLDALQIARDGAQHRRQARVEAQHLRGRPRRVECGVIGAQFVGDVTQFAFVEAAQLGAFAGVPQGTERRAEQLTQRIAVAEQRQRLLLAERQGRGVIALAAVGGGRQRQRSWPGGCIHSARQMQKP